MARRIQRFAMAVGLAALVVLLAAAPSEATTLPDGSITSAKPSNRTLKMPGKNWPSSIGSRACRKRKASSACSS